MSFDDTLARLGSRLTPLHYFGVVALFLVVLLAMLVVNRGPSGSTPEPQTAAAAPAAKSSAAVVAAVQAGPQWQELTGAQKKILRPLAATWNSLGYGHKNKWIALASNYPNRTPEDQEKLQSRMVEWAALKPVDRERARLNFAETKKLSASTRAAEWAAYQELSAEERKRLAEKGTGKPAGAAVAVSPVSNDKLTAVPITRRTGPLPESSTITKPQIDPNTLLPKVAAPVDTPASATTSVSLPAVNSDTPSPN